MRLPKVLIFSSSIYNNNVVDFILSISYIQVIAIYSNKASLLYSQKTKILASCVVFSSPVLVLYRLATAISSEPWPLRNRSETESSRTFGLDPPAVAQKEDDGYTNVVVVELDLQARAHHFLHSFISTTPIGRA